MAEYIPERNHVVWIDFEPTKGKEIDKCRPALVLSFRQYNRQTGLLICYPISTSIRGAATEVEVDNLDRPSVVAASLIQIMAWKDRKALFIVEAEEDVLEQVLLRILPLIGADGVIEKFIK